MKDVLERKLHKLVCTGQLDLKTAQSEIASNWIESYPTQSGPGNFYPPTQQASTAATSSEIYKTDLQNVWTT
ncbi:MAG: hypothetical protein JO232_11430 [Verrucomicrobia bacterium]|nr:hypothetical protein [Verrucomicrobiota bacterium]